MRIWPHAFILFLLEWVLGFSRIASAQTQEINIFKTIQNVGRANYRCDVTVGDNNAIVKFYSLQLRVLYSRLPVGDNSADNMDMLYYTKV